MSGVGDDAEHVIGLISDTHGLVRQSVFPALEGVELILHAGDVGENVLEELAAIAPIEAVFGNTDPVDDPHLRESIEGSERFRDYAKGDSDLDAIREEPGFRELVPG